MERLALAAGLSTTTVLLAGSVVVPWLGRVARQPISEDAPPRHRLKSGTPTMGGVLMIVGVLLALLATGAWTRELVPVVLAFCAYGAIGWVDDALSVRRGRNLGLRAREKLPLQILVGLGVGWSVARTAPQATVLTVPFVGSWDLGWAYVPFAALFIAGFANATNLTDGLDGLAAGTVAIACLGYAAIALHVGRQDLAVFSTAVFGACLGFLWYNAHPAQVIMGDVGSQALGGGLAAAAVAAKTEAAFVVAGIVFVIEALSVLLQVAYFKSTGGRRVFRSSPLHHHFELAGWPETRIVTRSYVVAALAALGALVMVRQGWR